MTWILLYTCAMGTTQFNRITDHPLLIKLSVFLSKKPQKKLCIYKSQGHTKKDTPHRRSAKYIITASSILWPIIAMFTIYARLAETRRSYALFSVPDDNTCICRSHARARRMRVGEGTINDLHIHSFPRLLILEAYVWMSWRGWEAETENKGDQSCNMTWRWHGSSSQGLDMYVTRKG
ncbi:hypothetical protein BGW80DRAFT_617366 [Lactifluus volemus]|nr:hypothetical protein BGW80DRAFT_617366 [Lactifluus volemus]